MAKKGKHSSTGKKNKQQSVTKNAEAVDNVSKYSRSSYVEEPKASAVKPAFEGVPNDVTIKSNRKSTRALGIFFAVFAGILAIVYLAGVVVFFNLYMPNTSIASQDISFKTADDIAKTLEDHFQNFDVKVTGSDLNFSVTASTASVTANTETIAKSALSSSNPWAWPYEIFLTRDVTEFVSDNTNEGNLASVIKENVDSVNTNKTMPENAKIVWSNANSSFLVEAEKYGTAIDESATKEKILSAIVSMQDSVLIGSSEYIQPTIYKTDARFDDAIKTANGYAKANFNILMGDTVAATVNGELISQWVVLGDDFSVTFDDAKATEWANGIAEGCNTVGTERTYTRPDGKQITVSGGTYGWQADGNGLAESVTSGIKSGSNENITVNTTQTAAVLAQKGQKDWGNRYVDVDLTEQHARFYDDSGNLVWESDIVSGSPSDGDATPTGVYVVNSKESPSRLKGPMKNGEAEWDSTVSYWMPFVGNLIGLHDATWQSAFGGSRYTSGYGSHGCVNLPLSAAQTIYSMINVGDVVVSHN